MSAFPLSGQCIPEWNTNPGTCCPYCTSKRHIVHGCTLIRNVHPFFSTKWISGYLDHQHCFYEKNSSGIDWHLSLMPFIRCSSSFSLDVHITGPPSVWSPASSHHVPWPSNMSLKHERCWFMTCTEISVDDKLKLSAGLCIYSQFLFHLFHLPLAFLDVQCIHWWRNFAIILFCCLSDQNMYR